MPWSSVLLRDVFLRRSKPVYAPLPTKDIPLLERSNGTSAGTGNLDQWHAAEGAPGKISMQLSDESIPDEPAEGAYADGKALQDYSSHSEIDFVTGNPPTERELRTLRKVPDKLPWAAFLIALIELCERFAFYGLSGPFQNYMQNKYNDPSGIPGAIGLGQSSATALSNFFQFWCYVTPILGAILADQYLGRYNTILYFAIIYMVGLVILFMTSLPIAIMHHISLPGLVVAMVIIGLGTGGIKSNVSPLIAEQYRNTKPFVKTLKSGERVIVDPSVTIQRIYMIFYLCINVGSLSSIATTTMELHIGFWSAYLLPLFMFVIGFTVIIAGRKQYVIRPPTGSVILQASRAIWIGLTHRSMDAAKPSHRSQVTTRYRNPWTNTFIDELKRALLACRVFAFYPIYWLVYNQMLNNFISQAAQMQRHGLPNDIMQNIDPLTIILCIPLCDRILYPSLRRLGISFRPITRIAWGFLLASLAMAYAAFVQHLIYAAPPCYDAPLVCTTGPDDTQQQQPNHVHVAVQSPAYLLIGLSEIFASVTGLEYAYTKAPAGMKSLIMSLFLLQTALGSAMGIVIAPVAKDPGLVSMYSALSLVTLVAGGVFWLCFRRLNASEDALNAIHNPDAAGMVPVRANEDEGSPSQIDMHAAERGGQNPGLVGQVNIAIPILAGERRRPEPAQAG